MAPRPGRIASTGRQRPRSTRKRKPKSTWAWVLKAGVSAMHTANNSGRPAAASRVGPLRSGRPKGCDVTAAPLAARPPSNAAIAAKSAKKRKIVAAKGSSAGVSKTNFTSQPHW